ncbi:related to transcription initiation factor TFIIF large subunit [Cephalotrichum gorgonifer]|uniref:Related to transcription initiation factor TFIIF large subunit n=1 Tax=Cephalotrichum gorgonifer TaxID=2041049 RepID=A0AAE8SVY0_9PEZI|nr:related to transcription initiation factor TFIIF large subunit [Cephalotrichum gorgonifer]
MSDLSSTAPNGQRPGPPGGPRPKPKANPLRPLRRRPANPPTARKRDPSSTTSAATLTTEETPLGLKRHGETDSAMQLEKLRSQFGGWSEPPPRAEYRDIPIVTTAKALREGIRYHVMRFPQPTGSKDTGHVDPTDQNAFTRPVTLHRRDPQQPPPGRVVRREEDLPEPEPVDEKEAERQQQLKAEREAQKTADQAKIAPTVKEMVSKKPKKTKEDQVIFNRMPKTEKGRKEAGLRYEEALPWHLEDVDGKNVWVGGYVSALSEANVAFVHEGSRFRMIPLEKWYRFSAKPALNLAPIEEGKDDKAPGASSSHWMMQAVEKRAEERKMKDEFRNSGKRGGPARGSSSLGEVRGYDEVDMEGDEFDDDDENTGFDHDEDTKITNDRIRKEQLGANLFGDADEKEVDAQEASKLRREMERRKASKKLKKTLKKRENVNDIESDDSASSADPFADSSSDDDDDEDEEEDESKAKADEDEKAKNDKDKTTPGTPSKGSTPSGKRQVDMIKKAKGLKRPGSPTLSESSGNESVLRKVAKKKAGSSAGHSRSTTPMPQGQGVPGQASQRRKMAGGSGSDGEVTGGEMSDGQPRKKKIKLIASSRKGTPAGSRAGSPLPASAAGTPGASPKDGQAIEAWEIVQALPQLPNGISIQNFLKLFEGRVGEKAEGGRMAKSEWIKMVRENCNYGPDKLLRRKS